MKKGRSLLLLSITVLTIAFNYQPVTQNQTKKVAEPGTKYYRKNPLQ